MSDIDLFSEDAIPEQWHVPPMSPEENQEMRRRFGLKAKKFGQEIINHFLHSDPEAEK